MRTSTHISKAQTYWTKPVKEKGTRNKKTYQRENIVIKDEWQHNIKGKDYIHISNQPLSTACARTHPYVSNDLMGLRCSELTWAHL